ncbi:hypothetical protein GDO81_019378 [Engystomops pustulosus]|uniref:Uncharacterized protein n=1 Tax=Engystomops pustulosus TaxID=76066 RepID=A0AAV6YX10_ENGPU|nr:hypothetical protein GDO81_019378 [Engystomops pustulosus]
MMMGPYKPQKHQHGDPKNTASPGHHHYTPRAAQRSMRTAAQASDPTTMILQVRMPLGLVLQVIVMSPCIIYHNIVFPVKGDVINVNNINIIIYLFIYRALLIIWCCIINEGFTYITLKEIYHLFSCIVSQTYLENMMQKPILFNP